ncbi:hypothetical protein [Cycloclasticus zancles]|uniref:Uncharacterized protein n=1 Tax=Cycloclasticus zancles 78-ME TaxID=1198232 RepID=S5TWU4_9GAMM|nr:hypothetical protein [Cycloclasticus zancles]AGS39463.1 hypothetical protein CYCME_1132 [Cycloclasticus zancles 78-ME]
MKTIGEYPKSLFRVFDKLEYAQQFLDGYLRFGTVLGYTEIEDKGRRDQTEGTGHIVNEGSDTKIKFCSNIFYTLCCHLTLEAALETGHGIYIVEIFNPLHLAEDITRVLRSSSAKHFGGIEGVSIQYDKGEVVEGKLSSYEKSRLTYCQKPVSYTHEEEFRFVFCRKEFAGTYLFIKVAGGVSGVIQQHT